MMFKILILQRYYGLGDTQIEYQILDRLSFKKFIGLESGDKVPDEKTVWAFREVLTSKGLVEKLFNQFRDYLEGKGNELWNDKSNKKRHKDIDARWTKKMVKHFMDIKIMQKWIIKANLLINTRLQIPLYMILSQWTIY